MQSRNVVSIRLLALMGLPYTINYLEKFGFTRAQVPPSLSLALGTSMITPLQMAQGYAVFANGGMRIVPFIIDSISNSQDQIIYQAKPLVACTSNCDANTAIAPRAISAQNAYLVTSTLRDVIQHGTAQPAKKLGRMDLAGKTGTTQNQIDAWFAGYNPDIVAIAWMGFDQPQSLNEYGVRAALPIWMQFMQTALKGKPEHMMEQPSGIVSIRINPTTGDRAAATDSSAIFEYFMMPHVPDKQSSYEDMGTITDDQGNQAAPNETQDVNSVINQNNASGDDSQQQQKSDDSVY
jgi:penicillin-binding protein 1A